MSTRVLVIDNDPNVTGLLKRGLCYEGFQVDAARSGVEGLYTARFNPPDLVILDLALPGIDGFEVCRRLRVHDPWQPILILTASDAVVDQVRCLDAGADDYVVKPFTFEVLLARVRAVLRRRGSAGHAYLCFADLCLDPRAHIARRVEREIYLTSTENQLLLEFLRNPRRALSKQDLIKNVWGNDFAANYNVLEVYVSYLRSKLEAAGEPRLIHTVRGVGYVLKEAREDEAKRSSS